MKDYNVNMGDCNIKMNLTLTVQQGSYSFFRKAETPEQAADFLNEVIHIGGTITIQTEDTHYTCNMEEVYPILEKWGIFKCRKGGCSSFQITSSYMLCEDCDEETYRRCLNLD